jgi:phenylacetate-CoA ligase
MSIVHLISHNILLKLSDLINGQSVLKYFDFLQKSQFWDIQKIRLFQEERLRKIIEHSVKTVPYYHDLFKTNGLHINDIQGIDDLKKLPILTKATIKKEGIDRFTSTTYSKRKRIINSSSGSTGEPLFYFNTKEAYSINLAANLRGWYWMGYKLGDKYVKISQNARKSPIKKLQDKASRNKYLASNPLIDSNFEYLLKEIEQYRPKIIRCYPDPLQFLAKYKQDHLEYSHIPLAINTTGNILHPETRKEIESVFKCEVFDSYRCEGNSAVFECPTHSCYHSTEEYGISEILDENGFPLKSGIGKLITTDLWNFAHPFIRYDTQDYVEISNNPCICGRHLLRINRILGRDNDILEISTGQKFIVHNFTGFFHVDSPILKRSIDQFQVIQRKDGTVTFRLVVNNKYNQKIADYIRAFWENELKTSITIEEVEQIPLLNSGKRCFIIKEQ